ncbi:MAG TPA: transposase [Ktedonobacterales bacterium]
MTNITCTSSSITSAGARNAGEPWRSSRAYDTIYLEDVRVANMVRNHHLAKSISDAGWAAFRTILACKAEWAGKRVILVEPAYTSQDCSACGERVPKSLSARTQVCPSCGLVLDRDENAARNIQ